MPTFWANEWKNNEASKQSIPMDSENGFIVCSETKESNEHSNDLKFLREKKSTKFLIPLLNEFIRETKEEEKEKENDQENWLMYKHDDKPKKKRKERTQKP